MKTAAVVCNILFFAFLCVVLVTDGPPTQTAYIVFSLLSLLIPIFSAVVIVRSKASDGWLSLQVRRKTSEEQAKTGGLGSRPTIMRTLTVVCNIVWLGFIVWAFVDQYPHPEEEGLLAFTVLIVLTPILNLAVMLRGGGLGVRAGLPVTKSSSTTP